MTEEDPPDWLDDGPPIDDDAYRPPLGADDVLRSRARERLAEVPRAAPKPPTPIVARGYTAKACAENTAERPGARKTWAMSSSTSFEPLPNTIWFALTPACLANATFNSKSSG